MNWWTEALAFIGGIGVTLLMIVRYIGGLAEKKVQQKLDRGLEDHKAKLDAVKDAAAFDYQRKIHDFSIYSTKKHEVYHDIYKSLLIAKSTLFHSYKLKCENTYNDFLTRSPQDIRAELENFSFSEIENFEKENIGLGPDHLLIRNKIDEDTQKYLKKMSDFNNNFRNNELFLSGEIAYFIEKVNENMIQLGRNYYLQQLSNEDELREEINRLVIFIRDTMKEELSIGSYTDT